MKETKKINSTLSKLYLNEEVTFETLRENTQDLRMKDVLEMGEKWSFLPDPILIIGETGVGKNMLAQAIHNHRKLNGFHEVTCSGIPESLFESEIFGHEKGAFTGASHKKIGLAKQAEGGTLFLDEIGEISLQLQAKLLRLVEQKRFYAVGSQEVTHSDIHIITATNKSLEQLQDPEIFRNDLFYRLSLCLEIPPLRERLEDLENLIHYFGDIYCQEVKKYHSKELLMRDDTLDYLKQYRWPGNIRELKFVMKRAIFTAMGGEEITPGHLPMWMTKDVAPSLNLANTEKKHILYVMKRANNNKEKAAKLLGVAVSTLYRKLVEYQKDLT